ncbi:nucleotidyl transferase AbiEii/AbiGii toxin family protein [Pseudomonas putida]|uniref:nucleotidyl transferase AbiEii/AbiGii toxin family protein n=1 Tax=Pseudomonas putida TaxID=303 RepID=UPI001EE33D35|nr:nucleotidyl transferase AbiEii/AbiGii toxin family protein [Pseudomonas putida]
MNLFDRLVEQALTNSPELAPLQVVVEKELLHHDIMRILSESGLLRSLCFIGGTCLRTCYGSRRLSEDLDFTGGASFKREDFSTLKQNLTTKLNDKYGLQVQVSEPVRETGNVDTWKLRVQTRPEARSLPAQQIHIDICAVPSYQRQPMVLLNPYGVDMGTEGLIVNAQSLEEIFVDKLLAFALRRGRIKNRDIWDLAWLRQRGVSQRMNSQSASFRTIRLRSGISYIRGRSAPPAWHWRKHSETSQTRCNDFCHFR